MKQLLVNKWYERTFRVDISLLKKEQPVSASTDLVVATFAKSYFIPQTELSFSLVEIPKTMLRAARKVNLPLLDKPQN